MTIIFKKLIKQQQILVPSSLKETYATHSLLF